MDTHTPPHTIQALKPMMLVGAGKAGKAEHQLLWERSEEGMPPGGEVGSGKQAGLHVGVEGGGEQRERGGNRGTEGCRVWRASLVHDAGWGCGEGGSLGRAGAGVPVPLAMKSHQDLSLEAQR